MKGKLRCVYLYLKTSLKHRIISSIARKAVKDTLKEESLKLWNEKVGKLVMQGDFINLLSEEKENVTWQSMVYNLPKGILPFALKSATNCLNTPR